MGISTSVQAAIEALQTAVDKEPTRVILLTCDGGGPRHEGAAHFMSAVTYWDAVAMFAAGINVMLSSTGVKFEKLAQDIAEALRNQSIDYPGQVH